MIQSNSDQIRILLEQAFRNGDRVSLVNLIGTFDARNHLVPTATEINEAASKLGFRVSLSEDGLHFEKSASSEGGFSVPESAVSRAFENYVSHLQTFQKK